MDVTFVKQEVAFLHNVFVESIFCFSSDSVINFSPIHRVSKYLFLLLQKKQQHTNQASTHPHRLNQISAFLLLLCQMSSYQV